MHIFSPGKIQVFIQVGGYLPLGAGWVKAEKGGGPPTPTDQWPVESVNLFNTAHLVTSCLNLLKVNFISSF